MRSILLLSLLLLLVAVGLAVNHFEGFEQSPRPARSASRTASSRSGSSSGSLDCARRPPAGSEGRCVLAGGRCYRTGCPCAGGRIRTGSGSGCAANSGCCIPNGMGFVMNFSPTARVNRVGQDQADNIRLIKEECARQNITGNQLAYVLATATYESGLRPIEEYGVCAPGGPRRSYCPYNGRGFVQLTHQRNYQRIGALVGQDLVRNPDLALNPSVAKFAICYGMRTGLFTGKKLDDYITSRRTDFVNARRIINGVSGAERFASAARWWQGQLAGRNNLTVVPGPYVVEGSSSSSSHSSSRASRSRRRL